jgi:hypothetical protein
MFATSLLPLEPRSTAGVGGRAGTRATGSTAPRAGTTRERATPGQRASGLARATTARRARLGPVLHALPYPGCGHPVVSRVDRLGVDLIAHAMAWGQHAVAARARHLAPSGAVWRAGLAPLGSDAGRRNAVAVAGKQQPRAQPPRHTQRSPPLENPLTHTVSRVCPIGPVRRQLRAFMVWCRYRHWVKQPWRTGSRHCRRYDQRGAPPLPRFALKPRPSRPPAGAARRPARAARPIARPAPHRALLP